VGKLEMKNNSMWRRVEVFFLKRRRSKKRKKKNLSLFLFHCVAMELVISLWRVLTTAGVGRKSSFIDSWMSETCLFSFAFASVSR
jgi:hypothetical protein